VKKTDEDKSMKRALQKKGVKTPFLNMGIKGEDKKGTKK